MGWLILLIQLRVTDMGDGFGDELDDCFGDGLTVWLLVCGAVYWFDVIVCWFLWFWAMVWLILLINCMVVHGIDDGLHDDSNDGFDDCGRVVG